MRSLPIPPLPGLSIPGPGAPGPDGGSSSLSSQSLASSLPSTASAPAAPVDSGNGPLSKESVIPDSLKPGREAVPIEDAHREPVNSNNEWKRTVMGPPKQVESSRQQLNEGHQVQGPLLGRVPSGDLATSLAQPSARFSQLPSADGPGSFSNALPAQCQQYISNSSASLGGYPGPYPNGARDVPMVQAPPAATTPAYGPVAHGEGATSRMPPPAAQLYSGYPGSSSRPGLGSHESNQDSITTSQLSEGLKKGCASCQSQGSCRECLKLPPLHRVFNNRDGTPIDDPPVLQPMLPVLLPSGPSGPSPRCTSCQRDYWHRYVSNEIAPGNPPVTFPQSELRSTLGLAAYFSNPSYDKPCPVHAFKVLIKRDPPLQSSVAAPSNTSGSEITSQGHRGSPYPRLDPVRESSRRPRPYSPGPTATLKGKERARTTDLPALMKMERNMSQQSLNNSGGSEARTPDMRMNIDCINDPQAASSSKQVDHGHKSWDECRRIQKRVVVV